ncbi:MAG: hypothetical protein Q8P28_05060 [Deltaproteobacteria bacterium]|nr:hypothetical protein [Deltaproteobacteria bacterium]
MANNRGMMLKGCPSNISVTARIASIWYSWLLSKWSFMIVFQLVNFAIYPIVFSPTGIAREQSLAIRLSLIAGYSFYPAQHFRLFSFPRTIFLLQTVVSFYSSCGTFEFIP